MKSFWDINGFIIIENFYSHKECDKLRKRTKELVKKFDFSSHKTIINSSDKQHAINKYFLESGDKVKITVMYRGREMARQEIGVETLNRVVKILDDFAQIDKQANLEGRRLSLILSPK